MVRQTGSMERLTFPEIMEKYPDQWVGLVDVDYKDTANIESAVVKETGDKDEILNRYVLQHAYEDALYTTPDNSWDNWLFW